MEQARPGVTEYEYWGIKAPIGTVPMPRPTFPDFVEGDHDLTSLREYLDTRVGSPLPSYDGSKKLYGSKQDVRTHISSAADITLWNYAGAIATK